MDLRHRLGALSIEPRLTRGHSEGGTTYVVTGLSRPVAIVGDAIFAGSMGGAANAHLQRGETPVPPLVLGTLALAAAVLRAVAPAGLDALPVAALVAGLTP